MIQLDSRQYLRLLQQVKKVGINHLFARNVLEGKLEGWVYVDRIEEPGAGYVLHPYGMALLFGQTEIPSFRKGLWSYLNDHPQARKQDEWLQVYPGTWADEVRSNCRGYREHERVNFKFRKASYLSARPSWNPLSGDARIIRTDQLVGTSITGTVVPSYFWRNAGDFSKNGVGFSVVVDGEILSTAFSAFILEDQLEIGIETVGNHQGKGYALWCCAALIDYCLENGYEPVWACRRENEGSFRLAEKLGFEATAFLPLFRFLSMESIGR